MYFYGIFFLIRSFNTYVVKEIKGFSKYKKIIFDSLHIALIPILAIEILGDYSGVIRFFIYHLQLIPKLFLFVLCGFFARSIFTSIFYFCYFHSYFLLLLPIQLVSSFISTAYSTPYSSTIISPACQYFNFICIYQFLE